MWDKYGDSIALVIVACIILTGLFFVTQAYDAHPRVFQGAFALLILGLILRSLRRRAWLQRQGCWLQVIHETPHEGSDWNLTITYRHDDQQVAFYGKKASPARAKVIALPPVESWHQTFPSWVSDKRDFILKTLSYSYEVEWTESAPYPVQNRGDGSQAEGQTKPQSSGYSWRLEDEHDSYRVRSLIYEESGFRLVTDLEMSGVAEFNWLGSDTALSTWTEPKDVPIDDQKREELLIRLASWCREQNTRISLSPDLIEEEYLWREERKGNTVVHNADGTSIVTPSQRTSP